MTRWQRFRRWLSVAVGCALMLAGCASSPWRPATGTGPARATVNVFVHLSVDDHRVIRRRVVTVNNPTDDEVILDCASMRVRFPAHAAAEVLLMPGDKGCDLQNNVTYVPIPDVTSIQGQLRSAPTRGTP